jgi:hypothetical protein
MPLIVSVIACLIMIRLHDTGLNAAHSAPALGH